MKRSLSRAGTLFTGTLFMEAATRAAAAAAAPEEEGEEEEEAEEEEKEAAAAEEEGPPQRRREGSTVGGFTAWRASPASPRRPVVPADEAI